MKCFLLLVVLSLAFPLPEIPGYGTPITVRQLAYHTSGIRDYTDLIELGSC